MSVHPAGDGIAWESDVDVDQPHGLDYRYVNHVAKAVDSRISHEHKAFADATVGGNHLPGGCRILAIFDATADMTAGIVDASHDVTDGYITGRGLIYDQTNNSFWCWTNSDGTTTGDPYQLMLGPGCISKAADFTWTGSHQWDSTNQFTDEIDVSEIQSDGTSTFTSLCDFSIITVDLIDETFSIDDHFDASGATFSGDVTFTANLDISGDVNLDGQLVLDANNVYDSGVFEVSNAGDYVKTHDLSSNLIACSLYCCTYDAGPVCSSAWTLAGAELGTSNHGMMVVDISTGNATVRTASTNAIWKMGTNGQQQDDATGWARLIVHRLT